MIVYFTIGNVRLLQPQPSPTAHVAIVLDCLGSLSPVADIVGVRRRDGLDGSFCKVAGFRNAEKYMDRLRDASEIFCDGFRKSLICIRPV